MFSYSRYASIIEHESLKGRNNTVPHRGLFLIISDKYRIFPKPGFVCSAGACSAGGAEASAGVVASPSSVEKWLNEQQFNFSEQEFKERELFSTRQLSFVAAKNLRGHCHVTHFRDICAAASEFDPLPDHFFYILEYNPQSRSA